MIRSNWLAGLTVLAMAVATVGTASAPAQALVPDAKGWVLYNQPAGTVTPFGTWPPATTVGVLTPGRYQIIFPGQAAPGGVVHVTAIALAPRWCQAENWFPSGVNEVAVIACHNISGAFVPSSFSAFFTSSTGGPAFGPYGYVDSQASGTLASQFNSSGATNTSTNGPPGQWLVTLPGLLSASNPGGGIQVTAVNASAGAFCKVAGWTSTSGGQNIVVQCFNATGAPFNTRFTLTYQYGVSLYGANNPPRAHGYVLYGPPTGPPDTNFNSLNPPGSNIVIPNGGGTAIVQFPSIGIAPNTVQVTAYGSTTGFCNLATPWWNNPTGNTVYLDYVICYTPTGSQTTAGFLASTSSLN